MDEVIKDLYYAVNNLLEEYLSNIDLETPKKIQDLVHWYELKYIECTKDGIKVNIELLIGIAEKLRDEIIDYNKRNKDIPIELIDKYNEITRILRFYSRKDYIIFKTYEEMEEIIGFMYMSPYDYIHRIKNKGER